MSVFATRTESIDLVRISTLADFNVSFACMHLLLSFCECISTLHGLCVSFAFDMRRRWHGTAVSADLWRMSNRHTFTGRSCSAPISIVFS